MDEKNQKTGLFGKPKKPAPLPERPSITTSDLAARLRIYEGRYSELRKNLVVIEQNMLSHHKKTNRELKDIYSEISELRHQITDMQDRITSIIKEFKLLATKSEVKVLARVLDYLDPVKFVRIDQVKDIVNNVLDEKEEEEGESIIKKRVE